MPFLGREFRAAPDYSSATGAEIDDEISRIIEGAYQQAKDVLRPRRAALATISEILLEHETIERVELEALLNRTLDEEVVADVHVIRVAQSA